METLETLHPLATTLSGYQVEGAQWLARTGRAILADPPGLGKTAQAVAACDAAEHRKILVIAPKSLLLHWRREIERFSSGDVAVLSTRKTLPDARWYIIGYEAATRRTDIDRPWDCLIVDEATRIKNSKTERAKTVFRLARKAKHVYLLAGILAPNRPDELWALLHTLDHRKWSSYWQFRAEHCLEAPVYSAGQLVAWKVVGVRDETALLDVLRPYVLQRDKSLLHLPEKLYETIVVGLTPEQAKLYNQMRSGLAAELAQGKLTIAKSAAEALIRLRQIVADPRLIGGERPGQKTEVICDLIEHLEDYRILVFSTFAQYVRLLRDDLGRRNIPCAIITGEESTTDRQLAEEALHDGRVRVLLGSYGAMGRGLNLQAATVVILADKPWSPEELQQAEDRVHRRGQTQPVTILSVRADGTVDDYVERVLDGKLQFLNTLELLKQVVTS